MQISLICCVHNPDLTLLERVVNSVAAQSVVADIKELLIVDNGSSPSLTERFDLSRWNFCIVCVEETLGLTYARLRGIKETCSDIVIFIDDDNILDRHYVEIVARAFRSDAMLGCVGASVIEPEWESPPHEDLIPFVGMLALRDRAEDTVSLSRRPLGDRPYGAGLGIRRDVCTAYLDHLENSACSRSLDRVGKQLLSGGDIEISLVAHQMGLKTGVLKELKLIHVIPKFRLRYSYLKKIARGHAISNIILYKLWNYEFSLFNELCIATRLFRRLRTRKSFGICFNKVQGIFIGLMKSRRLLE